MAVLPKAATSTIRRAVSCFLLSTNEQGKEVVAIFHRQATMPTFPSHWAAVSGSIETDETPLEAAKRELKEETNIRQLFSSSSLDAIPCQAGLYVDVPYVRKSRKVEESVTKETNSHQSQIEPGDVIRVYPFLFDFKDRSEDLTKSLRMKGTEHDRMAWIPPQELLDLKPTVPALARAFQHASCGEAICDFPPAVREWAADRESGAAALAKRAVQIVEQDERADPKDMKMIRPTMVSITNALTELEKKSMTPRELLESLELEGRRTVDMALKRVRGLIEQRKSNSGTFTIALFSRSSTLLSIVKLLLKEITAIQVICSQSSPGDEGFLMAKDLGDVPCIPDDVLIDKVVGDEVDLVLTGCDCIMSDKVANKVGTGKLLEAARQSPRCRTLCCSDRWKIWDDEFPPPLEPIFELIDRSLFDEIIIPPT